MASPGGLGALLCLFPAVSGDEAIDYIGCETRIAGAETNLDEQRSRKGAHVQAVLKALQQIALRIGVGGIGPKAGKAPCEAAHEGGGRVQLSIEDDLPGEAVTAQDAGNGFSLNHRAKFGGGRLLGGAIQAQRRGGHDAQSHPCPGFEFAGHNQAIEKTPQQHAAEHGKHQAATARQDLNQSAQRCRLGGPLGQ